MKDVIKYIFGGIIVITTFGIMFVKAKAVNGQSGVQQASNLINSTATGVAGIINAASGGNTPDTSQGQV